MNSRVHTVRRRGFTLIELLVVIVLLSVAASVALPRLSGLLPGQQMRSAGTRLASDLRYLYAYAVARREYVRMAIDIDSGEYWAETFQVVEKDDDAPRVLALQLRTDFSLAAESRHKDVREAEELTDSIVGRRSLPDGIRFAEVRIAEAFRERGGTAYIEFSPWGYGDDATILLEKGDEQRTVRLRGMLGEAGLLRQGA